VSWKKSKDGFQSIATSRVELMDDGGVHTYERADHLRGTCFHLDWPNLARPPQPVRTSSEAMGNITARGETYDSQARYDD
jgi:hypothetical protein